MPQYRQNFINKEWVIIAPERAKRPDQFAAMCEPKKPRPEHDPHCPFCPGNESQTPPALYVRDRGDASMDGDSNDWRLRVVPNKFAAVNSELCPDRRHVGRFLAADGFGIAEVVIETPRHNTSLGLLTKAEVRSVLEAYVSRYKSLSSNESVDRITVFRNHGVRAGTSLEHPHSQIIATPIVPPHVRHLMQQALIYHDTFGRCPYCVMIEEEISQAKRIVIEAKHHVVMCPYASRTPFEMKIIPKRHYSRFDDISFEEVDELADILRIVLKKLHDGLSDPDYNFVIDTSPTSDGDLHYDHWRLNITPRITTAAGFEIGSGIFINIMPPEDAAAFLRDVSVE